MRVVVLSALALSMAACSAESSGLDQGPPPLPDAATTTDAGTKVDAGSVQDAGNAQDATASQDAGSDSGTAPAADASPQDAGTAVDTGVDAGAADAARADASAPADASSADAAQADAASDAGAPPYAHTIAIDGVNDFRSSETFATSTQGYTLYVSWDTTYVYFGASGSDVQTTASGSKWWLLYVAASGATGSSTGVTYNTQTPTLPFPAAWHLRWKTTNDFTGAKSWVGGAWADANVSFSGGVFRGTGNDFVELRIARATLGNPSTLRVTSAFINEAGGNEATFAGAPSTTFSDGYNRAYTKAYQFNLSANPGSAAIIP